MAALHAALSSRAAPCSSQAHVFHVQQSAEPRGCLVLHLTFVEGWPKNPAKYWRLREAPGAAPARARPRCREMSRDRPEIRRGCCLSGRSRSTSATSPSRRRSPARRRQSGTSRRPLARATAGPSSRRCSGRLVSRRTSPSSHLALLTPPPPHTSPSSHLPLLTPPPPHTSPSSRLALLAPRASPHRPGASPHCMSSQTQEK